MHAYDEKARHGSTVRKIEAALLVLGAAAIVALVHRYGLGATLDALAPLGVWLPLLFSLEAVGKAANALGLVVVMPRGKDGVGFGEAFDATLQADSLNYLLPTASLGGNALLVRRFSSALGTGEAAVVVATANSAQTIAQFSFALLGAALAAGAFPPSAGLRSGLAAVAALCIIVLALTLAVQLGSPFSKVHSALKKMGLRISYLAERESRIAEVDARLRESLAARPLAFAFSIALFFFGWLWSAVELWLVLRLMGIEAGWATILAIEALTAFADGIVFFVPARAGAQEGGKVLAFALAGLSPSSGLAFGLFRRAREILWTVCGYALLLHRRKANA